MARARRVALCDDLRRRHPQRRLLVLMVNCRNRAAVAAYRKAGFVDTGELHARRPRRPAAPDAARACTAATSPADGMGQ